MPPYFVVYLVKAPQNRASTGAIALSHFHKLEMPSTMSRVVFLADTQSALLSIARSTFKE